jgi:Transcriptional regulator, AbiEi antitoxin
MALRNRTMARLASRSHGVVTRRRLLAVGFTTDEIRARLENGTLIRVHPGVYRVGHVAPSLEATYLAAVLACGDGALLSGRAAAYLWGLIKGPAPAPEVTAPTERRAATRRSARICREEAAKRRGVPITNVARTLIDIAGDDDLARACHEAGVKHKTTPRHVKAALARQPNAPGAAHLRAILVGDIRVTLSKLEREFLTRLEAAGLPLPVTNRVASARRVDCRWPDHALTVELDSYTFHNSRHAWELDHRREREARQRGDDFRRFTYDDVFERWPEVEAELRAECSRACASAPAPASSGACAAR